MNERPQGEEWVGQKVRLWVGLVLMGYPDNGVVVRWIPEYPDGPALEVALPEGSISPSVCVKTDWVFPYAERAAQ